MLTCYRTRRRLDAYLDGVLDERDARSTARHISACPACRRQIDSLRRVQALLRAVPAVPGPDWTGFWPGIVRGIEAGRRVAVAPAWPRWVRPTWAFGGAVAAALVLFVAVWQFGQPPTPAAASVIVSSAHTEDPHGAIMVYSAPENDVTVVWVFAAD